MYFDANIGLCWTPHPELLNPLYTYKNEVYCMNTSTSSAELRDRLCEAKRVTRKIDEFFGLTSKAKHYYPPLKFRNSKFKNSNGMIRQTY